jgi:hypothetical protein
MSTSPTTIHAQSNAGDVPVKTIQHQQRYGTSMCRDILRGFVTQKESDWFCYFIRLTISSQRTWIQDWSSGDFGSGSIHRCTNFAWTEAVHADASVAEFFCCTPCQT